MLLCAFGAWGQVPKEGIPGTCTKEGAAALGGTWIPRTDNLGELAFRKLSPAERQRLAGKAAAALDILRRAYPAPKGHDVWFNRSAARVIEPTLPSHINANLIFMEYRCFSDYRGAGPRLIPEIASDAWVTIDFNTLGAAMTNPLPDGYMLPGGLPMYQAEARLEGDFRGVPVLRGARDKNVTMLYIASRRELPLSTVSREDFLRVHGTYWLGKIREELADAEKGVAGATQRLAELAQRRGAAAKDADRWRQVALEQQRDFEKKAEAVRAKMAEVSRRNEAQLLALAPAERKSPAAFRALNRYQYEEVRFEAGPGILPVVVADDDFHQPRPDRAAVQYLTVFWRRVPSSAVKEAAMNELLGKIDFGALRALLDR